MCQIFSIFALHSPPSSITEIIHQESHPDVNNDPKASEEFHRVKMAYDRLRSIHEEDDKQSHEDFERTEEERSKGRGNTFKSGVNINDIRCSLYLQASQYFACSAHISLN